MSNHRALITGIHGFCGRHLASYLKQQGFTVFGIDLAAQPALSGVTTFVGDIRDPVLVQQAISEARPAFIFHLAALITPQANLNALYAVNVEGTRCVLDAVHRTDVDSVILIAGSSAVYGLVQANELPISESQPFRPSNAYAVSKIAQEMLAYTYYARFGLKVIRARAFNLVGPGQPATLVCAAFAKQIAEIKAGQSEPTLRVGNLDSRRDFVDVRDVVRAYHSIVRQGQPGQVYNVCSGQAVSIQACLDQLLRLAGVTISVEQDPDRMRPSDIPVSVGDGSLLLQQTGWHPTIPLAQSLTDLMEDWRHRIEES